MRKRAAVRVFAQPHWELHGLDTAPAAVEYVRAKYKANALCGVLVDVSYSDNYFDVVSVLDAIYYFADPRTELAEIRRSLKPD